MNAAFLQDIVSGGISTLGAIVNNGECRILAPSNVGGTDNQGFPAETFAAQASDWTPCNWAANEAWSRLAAGEEVVGAKSTGHIGYQVMIPKYDEDGVVVNVSVAYKVELRRVIGVDDAITIDLHSIIDQGNAAWLMRGSDQDTK